ncbi:MAG: MATE family efflux transporter [Flavobacteriaceae bacterium]|nr:MATE family efflux transporter [Flavobacteriaceae bacterium]
MKEVSFKNIQSLALPAIISGITEPILSATDAAVVGNIPINGTEALAAVGVVGSFLSMLIWVLAQTRSAISTIVAQNLGAGKVEDLNRFPGQAIVFNVGLGVLILVITSLFIKEIFILLNADGLVLDFSMSYYKIRVWGFPLTLFTFALFGVFRGLQNTLYPMIVAGCGALLNVGLDFLLVYGYGSLIPALGVDGAAWASLIAQAFMAVFVLVIYLRKSQISLAFWGPIHVEISRLITMSVHLFFRSIALNAVLIMAVREANGISPEAMAAHTIAINIWLFSAFFIDGYGAAGNLIGGKLLGAKQYTALWQLTKKVNQYNLVVAVGLMILGGLLYQQIGQLFVRDPAVLPLYYSMFFLIVLIQPFNAIAFTMDAIFKGLGEMAFLRNSLIGAALFGFAPVLLWSHYVDGGLNGIWWALLSWLVFRAAVLVLKFKKSYYPLAIKNPAPQN